MGKYGNEVKQLLDAIGGKENIQAVLCTFNIHTIVDPPLRNSTSRLTCLFL